MSENSELKRQRQRQKNCNAISCDFYPDRDKIFIENRSSTNADVPLGTKLNLQFIRALDCLYCVPNGTLFNAFSLMFYKYFVPKGTFSNVNFFSHFLMKRETR